MLLGWWLLTRYIDRGSCINNAAVGPDTVPARRSGLHFKTHISVCWIAQLQRGGDYISEWAWVEGWRNGEKGRNKDKSSVHIATISLVIYLTQGVL